MNFTSGFWPCAKADAQPAETQIARVTNVSIRPFIEFLRIVELRCGVANVCDACRRNRVVSYVRKESDGSVELKKAESRGHARHPITKKRVRRPPEDSC